MMTMIPNHVLLGALARERQARLQATASRRRRSVVAPMRMRVGAVLISVGTSLGGDRLERRVQSTASRQAA